MKKAIIVVVLTLVLAGCQTFDSETGKRTTYGKVLWWTKDIIHEGNE